MLTPLTQLGALKRFFFLSPGSERSLEKEAFALVIDKLFGIRFLRVKKWHLRVRKTNNRLNQTVKVKSSLQSRSSWIGLTEGDRYGSSEPQIGDIWCLWLGFFHHGLIQSKMVRGTRSGARPGRRPLARASDRVWGQRSEHFSKLLQQKWENDHTERMVGT